MTIDEAMKVLQLMTENRNVSSLEKCIEALKLGIEALKRVKVNRHHYGGLNWKALPGEIEK